jgi:hypothetical protein
MNTTKLNFWFKLQDGSEIGRPLRKAFKKQQSLSRVKPRNTFATHHNSLWHALDKENPRPRKPFATVKPDATIELDPTGAFVLSKPVKPGDTVFISGAPADGKYNLKDGKILIVNNGQVSEILTIEEIKKRGGI